jgi:hypothetical protein
MSWRFVLHLGMCVNMALEERGFLLMEVVLLIESNQECFLDPILLWQIWFLQIAEFC